MKRQPYKTVKTKLKKILINDNDISKIQQHVEILNKATILVYQFIKAWCLYRFDQELSLPVIDKNFIKSCFRTMCIRSNRGSKPQGEKLILESELAKFREIFFKDYERPNLTCLSAAEAYQIIEMHTCYVNNIFMHFTSRLKKFIKCTAILSGTKYERQKTVWTIYNALAKSDPSTLEGDNLDWYFLYRCKVLPAGPFENCLEYDIKKYPFKYLWHMIWMDTALETYGCKTFSAFPLRHSAIPSYITLDTAYIGRNLLKGVDRKLIGSDRWVTTNQQQIFSIVFQTHRRIFRKKDYNFHYLLRTNGYAVDIIFEIKGYDKWSRKKKTEANEETIPYVENLNQEIKNGYQNKKIVGADPGKYNLIYLTDREKKIKYTKNQRMHETGEKRFAKALLKRRRRNGIEVIESSLSNFNSNTCFLNKFLDYVRAKHEVLKQTLTFYSDMWFRAWDFRKFRLKQKSESKLLNNISKTFGEDCVIAYGDWKGNNQLKHQKATLGIGMRNIIEKKFNIFLVDEYKTSKLHHNCQQELTNAVINGQKKHRCLKCLSCESRFQNSSSQSGRSVFVNRDFNAAANIWYLGVLELFNQDRPASFRRGRPVLG